MRRAAAEGAGTALLLAAVVGSGIMGERLAGGNVALALLANTAAAGAALVALIRTFGPVSGARGDRHLLRHQTRGRGLLRRGAARGRGGATLFFHWLVPAEDAATQEVIVPRKAGGAGSRATS